MKKTLLGSILLGSLVMPLSVMAEDPVVMEEKSFFTPNFTYWDTSVNYLDWSAGTEQRAAGKTNFSDFMWLLLLW